MEEPNENNELKIKIEKVDEVSDTVNSDSTRIFKCLVEGCKYTFAKRSRLDIHMRKHSNERPFECDECDKTYTNESHLRRHKKALHPEDGVIATLPCPHDGCMKQLANVYSLRKHIERYHNPLRKYRFECTYCNAGFLRKSQLNVHLSTHTGKPPYQCEPCNMGFMMKSHYTKHLIYHKTFECACGTTFTRWTVFCQHKKTCKTCEKTFTCQYCNKTFQAKNKYNVHLKTHLEDKPKFFCTYGECTRVYKYERNLRVHINRFHKKIAPKKIKCTVEGCDKTFVTNNNLKYHLQLHANPYKPKFPRNLRKDCGKPKKSSKLAMTGLTLPYEGEKMLLEDKEANIYLNSDTDGIYSSDANTNINSDFTDAEMEQTSPNKRKYSDDTSSYDHFLTPSTSGIKRIKKESSSYENDSELQEDIKPIKIKQEKMDDSSESTSEISEYMINSYDESDQSEITQNNYESSFVQVNIKPEPKSDDSDLSDTDQTENFEDELHDDLSLKKDNISPQLTKIRIKVENDLKDELFNDKPTNLSNESNNIDQFFGTSPNKIFIKTENVQNDNFETESSTNDDENSNCQSDNMYENGEQKIHIKKEAT